MKMIALTLLSIASLNSQAGDFQNIQLKVDTCHQVGSFAADFYALRVAGQPKQVFGDDGSHMNMIFRYAVDYAWGEATSGQDAEARVMAKCMDNYNSAVANDRNGVSRPSKLN